MAFADTWSALQTRLPVGATIQNWTAHSGVVGEAFTVESVGQDAIVVNVPGAVAPQSVRRADFEAVYDLWGSYVGGATPRQALTPLTFYSKYVISILHWLQGQSGGRLP